MARLSKFQPLLSLTLIALIVATVSALPPGLVEREVEGNEYAIASSMSSITKNVLQVGSSEFSPDDGKSQGTDAQIKYASPFKKGEYAMICQNNGLDNKDRTFKCQRSGYFCDGAGNLKRKQEDQDWDCESFQCECRDLFPKPLCYMWSGAVFCVRDLQEDNRLPSTSDSDISERSGMSTRDVEVPAQWNVNNYALNCFDSGPASKICLDKGYHCNCQGKLVWKGEGKADSACDAEWCKCINLYPQPKCFWEASNFMCSREVNDTLVDSPPAIRGRAEEKSNSILELRIGSDTSATPRTEHFSEHKRNQTELALRNISNLVKRHNYAMVCLGDSILTSLCNSEGYQCDENGRIQKKKGWKGDEDCERVDVCSCVDLFPKPKCFWSKAGSLCYRDIPQIDPPPPLAPTAVSERTVSDLMKRHSYAMVCLDDSVMTSICNEEGYYCDSNGKVQKKKDSKGDADCGEKGVCTCVDLFPKPKCFWRKAGTLCARDRPQIEPPPSSISTAVSERVVGNLVKRHNWAMNCWDSSVMTALCNGVGYYCDKDGKLQLGAGKKGDKDCTDDTPCTCVNLFPQPKCFLLGSGQLGCARDGNSTQEDASSTPTNSVTTQSRDLVSLEKRHDWAMVCSDNQKLTKECQTIGYFCNQKGNLDIKKDSTHDTKCFAKGECFCVDLAPKPMCYYSIVGSLGCYNLKDGLRLGRRSIEGSGPSVRLRELSLASRHVETVSFQNPECYSADNGAFACALRREEGTLDKVFHYNVSVQASVDTTPRRAGFSHTSPLMKRHNYAMNCIGDKESTMFCQQHGYYCSSSGTLRHKGDDANWMCEHPTCLCINLNPGPFCAVRQKQIVCVPKPPVKDEVKRGEFTPQLAPAIVRAIKHERVREKALQPAMPTDLAIRSSSSLVKRNDYAMVCLDAKWFTDYCQGFGYYCTAKGKLRHLETKDTHYMCEDDICKCVNLNPAPLCVKAKGQVVCKTKPRVKDEVKRAFVLQLHAPLALASGVEVEVVNASSVVKRMEVGESYGEKQTEAVFDGDFDVEVVRDENAYRELMREARQSGSVVLDARQGEPRDLF